MRPSQWEGCRLEQALCNGLRYLAHLYRPLAAALLGLDAARTGAQARQVAAVDIYVQLDAEQARGFALIASEPREFTIVNIVGSIDMRKLHELEGQFGIPRLELEQKK